MAVKGLDLFCGGGGATFGYVLAGAEMTGVDEKYYDCGYAGQSGQNWVRANALNILKASRFLRRFDFIHASPPCQPYGRTRTLIQSQGSRLSEKAYLFEVRSLLRASGKPYVLEQPEHSPIRHDLVLCGSQFGLEIIKDGEVRQLRRHRAFEISTHIPFPHACNHIGKPLGIYGNKGDRIAGGGHTVDTLEEARELMGIDWMNWAAIIEAIPPAYTHHIGTHLFKSL